MNPPNGEEYETRMEGYLQYREEEKILKMMRKDGFLRKKYVRACVCEKKIVTLHAFMNREFTLDIYRELLERLQAHGYALISYSDYLKKERQKTSEKFVVLRHDVDKKPENSLRTAQIEHSIGAKASYYFRVPESGCYKGCSLPLPDAIRSIERLGHEIGYHYEDMALCNGNVDKAYDHFQIWLDYFRRFYPVETVCMHGAPTNQYDGRDLWKKYDYKVLGIIGEPYFDTDFSKVLYLTDTGRCWDGYKVSVRDKIPQYQDEWTKKGWSWHTTAQLIQAIEKNQLPDQLMMTTHPQRWTNNRLAWWKELVMQNTKNIVKRILIKNKKDKN